VTKSPSSSSPSKRKAWLTVVLAVALMVGVGSIAFNVMLGTVLDDMETHQKQLLAQHQAAVIGEQAERYYLRKLRLPKNIGALYEELPVPIDPWGNPFDLVLNGEGTDFSVYSYGADGVTGGAGENADLRHN
jgi:hypothetical protein